jgi:hypothetical protein
MSETTRELLNCADCPLALPDDSGIKQRMCATVAHRTMRTVVGRYDTISDGGTASETVEILMSDKSIVAAARDACEQRKLVLENTTAGYSGIGY